MSAPTPRSGILEIAPYVGGTSSLEGARRIIKLSSNEGALGPSPKAVEAVRDAAATMHRYPDGGASALREAIGARFSLDPARIVCGAGSDELISLLAYSYAGTGDEVLYTEHGFLMYPIAALAAGARPVKAPETNLRADIDLLLEKVNAKTRIVFIANPNNPTGSYLSGQEIRRLRRDLREDILLVIDAAYAEFVDAPDYSDGADLVEGSDNVVMTRTFSKIYALGGLRLGWCYAPSAIADVLNRVRGPFNVSSLAQAAGVATLEDREFTDRAAAHNSRWRDWTIAEVRALGLDVPPSAGNFILPRFAAEGPHTADRADAFLKSRGIIVRKMGSYGLGEHLRVSIGREDEMRAFVATLGDFMNP